MSEVKKKRVKLWLNTSAKGIKYLGGKDPETGERYSIFVDKDNKDVRNVCIKKDGDEKLRNLADLSLRTFEQDGVEKSIHVAEGYLLGENMYYTNEDGTTHMTRKDGSIVIGKNGEPVENATHNLVIG